MYFEDFSIQLTVYLGFLSKLLKYIEQKLIYRLVYIFSLNIPQKFQEMTKVVLLEK